MAPLSPTARHVSPNDDLDDVLNGIIEGRDVAPVSTAQSQTNTLGKKRPDNTGGLGIDEEIIITKKRIPIPKLDDQRLLSDPGIPRLHEGKPRRTTEQDEDGADDSPQRAGPEESADSMQGMEDGTRGNETSHEEAERPLQVQPPAAPISQMGEDPDEDELDALLAEGAPDTSTMPKDLPSRTKEIDNDPFADEMEAMADMDDMW
ncbi:hypothetical protein NX059_006413 [Plenodomus lindquistii]|nr:hypothetical protein NX059_006413 [Plenodomus lindquistii]